MMLRTKQIGISIAAILLVILSVTLGIIQLAGSEEFPKKTNLGLYQDQPQGKIQERKPNRLIDQKSPYLLQHAYNPVNWYPWGTEAFEKSQRDNKPIFLSVGYSTCHWCHVMERESFSNPEIASILNKYFVSIKVDREERPDVDQVYMAFVQASTGGGGWPMSVFLTPDLKPFYGGTYFPPTQTNGRPGFKKIILEIAKTWREKSQMILSSAEAILEQLKKFNKVTGNGDLKLEEDLLIQTYRWYKRNYNNNLGGFGSAPKFPRPVNFNFLVRYHKKTGDLKALEMVTNTLLKMSHGGIHDHLGGGFHRYSTDKRWFLPHFEKMLYDQAQLATAYLEAYQITRDKGFAEVARSIFGYVLRDMTGKEGGFYSAEDADSSVSYAHLEKHAEGSFYVWTDQQIRELLNEDTNIFSFFYNVKKNGNIEQDPFGEFKHKNVLHITSTIQETAQKYGRSVEEIQEILGRSRKTLFQAMLRKPRPLLDDKILTSWNGLMISALATGHQVLQDQTYLEAAIKAASFIADKLYDSRTATLKRRYRNGDITGTGLIDDYAFFIQGLLDLYESSMDDRWLMLAMDLVKSQIRLFEDQEDGGFFSTTGEDPSILIRMKEDYDGAEPSPNSISVLNLLRLAEISGNHLWRELANKTILSFRRNLKNAPYTLPKLMTGVDFYLDKPTQILIVGKKGSEDTQAILREVHRRFIPNKIVFLVDGGKAHKHLQKKLKILANLRQIEGKATAYICKDYTCKLPTNNIKVISRLLDEL